jgi:hypothetical protein
MKRLGNLVSGKRRRELSLKPIEQNRPVFAPVGNYVCGDRLAPYRIGLADHSHGNYAGDGADCFLDLLGIYVVGAGVDHSVKPAGKMEIPGRIEVCDVSEGTPSFRIAEVRRDHRIAGLQLAVVGRTTASRPEAHLYLRNDPAAAGAQQVVAIVDGLMIVNAENREWPAGLEASIELY